MQIELRQKPRRRDRDTLHWKRSVPFVLNPRGILIHRVCRISTHYTHRGCHVSYGYWCGNGTTARFCELFSDPPENRLLCVRCEAAAVAAGQPTADELAGRHVCIGKVKTQRLCCRNQEN